MNRHRRNGGLVAAVAAIVMGTLVLPGGATDAALPTPPPAGPELTSFQIDGNPEGPNDWDAPYTAPGTTPIGYQTSGLLPANFYPTFSVPDYPDPAAQPVQNPAFGVIPGQFEFCSPPQADDAFDGSAASLRNLRLANPVISNPVSGSPGGVQILECSTPSPPKNDLTAAYAAYEIVNVPNGAGFQQQYVLYGAWGREPAGGELNFYIPVSDGVDGPVDGSGLPTNTVNDRLIAFNYSDSPTLVFSYQIWKWSGTAWVVETEVAPGEVTADFQAAAAADGSFGEFALNLTTSGVLPDDETAGCQVSIVADYVFTATGNSASAALKDYVEGPGFPFTNCGSLEVEKQAPFVPDVPTDFEFAVNQADGATIFPSGQVPTTTPPSSTTALTDTLSVPYPGGTYPNPDVYDPMLSESDYRITEAPTPPGWQLVSLECTYKDIYSPILDGAGNPTGDFNTVTTTYAGGNTPFAVPPAFDSDGDGDIDEIDRAFFRTSCVIANDANTITIVKDAVPDDATADFQFDGAIDATPVSFTLNDPTSPSRTFIVEQATTNQFIEDQTALPPFWDLSDVTCDVPQDDPQVSWDVAGADSILAVSIGAGDVRNVTCTFTNTQRLQPYQIIVTPATATNRLGDPHRFTVELRTDADDDGALDDPVVGASVDLSWTGAAGSGIDEVNGATVPGAPADTATCTTLAPFSPFLGGLCTVDVTSPDDVGTGQLVASFDLPNPGAGVPELPSPSTDNTCTTPTIGADNLITVCNAVQDVQRIEASGSKAWVGYEVTVEPDATNPVDVAHTFTIDVVRTDGTTPTPAAGVTVNFDWTGVGSVTEVNGAPDPGATSCVTDAAGRCTVTVESADFGSGTLTVTSVDGDLLGEGVQTETPTPGSDLTATKTWVDWRVLLTPPAATNAVDQEHVFTATLQRNDGSGWTAEGADNLIAVTWSGPAGSVITAASGGGVVAPDGLAAGCNTDVNGQCTFTVDSPANGTGTLTAYNVIVALPGYVPPGGEPGSPFPFDIDDVTADKTWVALRGTVTPLVATNLVGDEHEFTILIETIDGMGTWAPAPAGTTVDFAWVGGGAVTSVVDPGPDATSCTLGAAGTCVVTVDSETPGFGILTIGDVTSLIIDGTQLVPPGGSLPVSDADASAEIDSRIGTKTWIGLQADVQTTATNLVGDDHDFTLTATYDDGTGTQPVPDGSTIEFTWTGAGQVTAPGAGATSCTTTGGSCTVTVSSATPGSGTIEVTSVEVTIDGTTLTGVTTTTPPSLVAAVGGALTADKTWIEFQADVQATAVNLVGDDHVFTLTATYDDGTPGAPYPVPDGSTIEYTWTGANAATPPTSCATTGGTCEVTVSSDVPGSGTLTITAVSADFAGDIVLDTALDAIVGGSLSADKTWVEFQADVQTTATNLAGDDHDFTITATYDDGTGEQPVPDGSTVNFTWTGAGQVTAPSAGATSCTTTGGSCTVTVSSATPGSGTIEVTSVEVTIDGTTLTGVTTTTPPSLVAAEGGALTADKTWIAFDVDITPLTDVNPVGVDHTFTIAVQIDDGTGLVPLSIPPDSGTVDWSFEAPDGSTTTGTCVLEAGGTCEVVQGSTDFGTGTLTATSLSVTIGGVAFGPIDLTAAASGQSSDLAIPVDADKTWVDWRVTTSGDATNAVDEEHVFTLTLERNDGTGWIPEGAGNLIAVTWSGPAGSTITAASGGTPAPDGLSAFCTTDASGQCTITVDSPNSGAGTLTATEVTVSLPGYAPPDGAPGDPFIFDIEDEAVVKTWVAIRGTVTPPTATNVVGDEHEFTILIETLSNGAWEPAPAGTTVNFTWTGVGAVTNVVAPGPDVGTSCTLDAAGECVVTVDSDDIGSGTLVVTEVTSLIIDGTELVPPGGTLPVGDADASPDVDSREGVKTWIEFQADVQTTATNVAGDDHTFTIEAYYDDGTGPILVPGGSTIEFSWTGDGSVTQVNGAPDPGATSCTTVGAICTVTVSSATPGTGTIAVTSVMATIDGTQLTGDTTTTPPGLVAFAGGALQADKTWVEFQADVQPTATNVVGDDHVFTLTATYDDGTGPQPVPDGSTIEYLWAGAGTAAPPTACATAGGTCTVTVSSDVVGTGTLTITAVSATFDGDTLLDNSVDAIVGGSLDADKTWIQFQADVQTTATNLVGDPHTFTIEAYYDDGTVPTVVPDGSTIEFTWTGDGAVTEVNGAPDPGATACTTVGNVCTVTVESDTPGTGTIEVTSVTADIGGSVLTGDTTTTPPGLVAFAGGSLTAEKSWVLLSAAVTETATNLSGDDHTFDLIAFYDIGNGESTVPNGSTIAFTWTGAGQVTATNGAPDEGATTCTTTGGACTVTVSSATPGTGTIEITSVTTNLNGAQLVGVTTTTPPSLVAVVGGSLTADKTWIDLTVGVAATSINLTGDDHVFTLTAVYDDGTGPQPANGASFAYTWTGTGTAAPPSPCVAAPDGNTCEVTVSSTDPGTGTITIESVTATVGGTTFTDVTAVATSGESLTADKTWVAFDVDITPLEAINPVGDDHTFTISVRIDDGSGLTPLTDPPYSFTGTVEWSFEDSDRNVIETDTCTLDTATGTCEVVQNPGIGGVYYLRATALDVVLDGVTLPTVDLEAEGSGQADGLTIPVEAVKAWVGYSLEVTPPQATNLWPADPDHVVTLSLAVFPPGTELAPIDGQPLDVTLTSSVATITAVGGGGTIAPDGKSATCITDVNGDCDVTITSTGPGTATLEASYTLELEQQTIIVEGSNPAQKTWRQFRVRVTPDTARNLLGEPHQFTVIVERTDNGTNWQPVANAVPTVNVTAPATISSENCSAGTNANGRCTVTVTSPRASTVTLRAAYQAQIGEATTTVRDTAEKTWIDYRISVTPPQAENLVDTDHQFTVTVRVNNGDGEGYVPLAGARPSLSLSGPGTIVSQTCSSGTADNGTCLVTIRSGSPGTSRLEATYLGRAGGETATYSDTGRKTWVDYRISVAPEVATNQVGDPHTFTVTLTTNRGSGFGPAGQEVVRIGADGVGRIVSIQAAGPNAGTCRTNNAGTCRVTVNSSDPGTLTLTASYGANVGGTQRTYSDSGRKSWVPPDLPKTGSNARDIALLGGILAGIGGLLLLTSRRRRATS